MAQHRSYSQINQLRTCGEQYRLERIEGVPSRPSCAAVAGKVFHTLSEQIDKLLHLHPDQDAESLVHLHLGETLYGVFDAAVAEEEEASGFPRADWKRYGRKTAEKPNAEDMSWFLEVGIPNCVKAYVEWRRETAFELEEIPGFGPAIEVPFNYYIDGQLVHGWIDRVFKPWMPVDLKTGQKPKTDEQLGLYRAALLAGLPGITPSPWSYYVYGLKTGKAKMTPPLRVDHWDDRKLGLVYSPARIQIESGLFIPHPGDACFHCGVSEHCDYVQSVV